MSKTVEFYSEVLGMKLLKTLDLGGSFGQHFFFDCGNGDSIAFFWFPNAPDAAPGIASRAPGSGHSAQGSLNSISLHVDPKVLDEIASRLRASGVQVCLRNNDPAIDAPRIVQFDDPDGISIQLCERSRKRHYPAPVLPKDSSCARVDLALAPHAAAKAFTYGGEGVQS